MSRPAALINQDRPQPAPYRPPDARDTHYYEAVKAAYMLDFSIGQTTQLAALSNTFDVPMFSMNRRVEPGYSAYTHSDLSGFENHFEEFAHSTSPEETLMIKAMIENNIDLRTTVEDYGVTRFVTGLLDPINLVPVPFAIGKGFLNGARTALKRGVPIVAGTEAIRHNIDPTARFDETLFAVLGGSLFMGLMGGVAGKLPRDGLTVGQAMNKLIPPESLAPRGQTNAFAGLVPFRMGTTGGVFKRITQGMKSAVANGELLSKTVDHEKIKLREEFDDPELGIGETVHIDYDGKQVMLAEVHGDKIKINSVELDEALRGKGIGTAIYKTLIEHAEKQGKTVVSDLAVSKDAVRVWRNLEDEGIVVKEGDNVKTLDDGSKVSEGTDPVFEVKRLIDPDQKQIAPEIREELADRQLGVDALNRNLRILDKSVSELKQKVKNAPVAGGAKTKAKNELARTLKSRNTMEGELRTAKSALQDLNVQATYMLDAATIKDWDLLPTGYNKLLGKLDQFPWWGLMKTPLREVAPDLAVKYQMFALKIASTPGLNNKGNRLSASTGPPVESLAIEHTGKWIVANHEVGNIYRGYLGYGSTSSQVKQFTIDSSQRIRSSLNKAVNGERLTTTSDGKLTKQEFDRQISAAIADGGKHPVPEVEQSAAIMSKMLEEMGDDLKAMGVSATQKNIQRRLDKVIKEQDKFNKDWGGKYSVDDMPPALSNLHDRIMSDKMALEERLQNYIDAKNPEYLHRMWLADEVIANELPLKQMLIESFTADPKKGKTPIQDTPDRVVGDKIIKGKKRWIDNDHPDAIEARANEAYNSILHEAETGNNGMYAPNTHNKRDWLEGRRDAIEAGEGGVTGDVAAIQLTIIEGKLKKLELNEHTGGMSGPLIAKRLDLDDRELLKMGVIEGDVNIWTNHYVQRTAPIIETARVFGHGDGKATAHIQSIIEEVELRAEAETDPKKAAILHKQAERGYQHMTELVDIVHGVYQIPNDPHAITGRVLRMLRNFNVLGAMGRSVFMALGDIGNVVVSQGLRRALGHGVEHFASGITDGNIKMMRDEVDLAGSVSEVVLGMRYHQMTDFSAAVSGSGRLAKAERVLANASQRFFLLNLLGPWTDMARRFSGGMLQSQLINFSRQWKAGTLSLDDQTIMGRLGINKAQAIQFVDEWEASGSLKHKSMFIANTTQWVSKQAVRTFRAAMNTEINRMVPTPGAVDKPKALLKSEWWKIIGQYRGFSIGATHRIFGAGMHQKDASKYSGLASMVGIAMMVDALKRPDYIELPVEEQLLRAVELSGVTGIVLDLNDTIERASAGSIGLRPALGMDIRERNPNWANRMGTVGAVPNSWLTLMYALTSDEAETDDLARAIRYTMPYNNLLWINELSNRAQRASVDFIEDLDNE